VCHVLNELGGCEQVAVLFWSVCVTGTIVCMRPFWGGGGGRVAQTVPMMWDDTSCYELTSTTLRADLQGCYVQFGISTFRDNCNAIASRLVSTTWLASRHSPVSRCFAYHTQPIPAVSCMQWGWLPSCLLEWDPPSFIKRILCSQNVFVFC